MMFPDEIDALRKEYGLDPDLYSDEAVVQTLEMTKLLAQEYVKLMTNGLDEEVRIKVRRKLIKLGYTVEEILDHENIREKVKFGFKLDLKGKDIDRIQKLTKDHENVYREIQGRALKARMKKILKES